MIPGNEEPNLAARILIIDDDPSIRTLLGVTLVHSGYRVETAENGRKAIDLLRSETFDLVLVDLFLKDGIHGLQIIEHLRQKQPDMAIMVLTGYSSFETVLQSLRLGVDEYLVKPVETVILRERIRETLAKRRVQQPTQRFPRELKPTSPETLPDTATHLDFAGLSIDQQAGQIAFQGLPLELIGPEFRLLLYLIQQAPRPVNSVELLLEGTGYHATSRQAEEIVNQHFLRIQEKLDRLGCGGIVIQRLPEGYIISSR
jgi:two-component system OmpR family response regulator